MLTSSPALSSYSNHSPSLKSIPVNLVPDSAPFASHSPYESSISITPHHPPPLQTLPNAHSTHISPKLNKLQPPTIKPQHIAPLRRTVTPVCRRPLPIIDHIRAVLPLAVLTPPDKVGRALAAGLLVLLEPGQGHPVRVDLSARRALHAEGVEVGAALGVRRAEVCDAVCLEITCKRWFRGWMVGREKGRKWVGKQVPCQVSGEA